MPEYKALIAARQMARSARMSRQAKTKPTLEDRVKRLEDRVKELERTTSPHYLAGYVD